MGDLQWPAIWRGAVSTAMFAVPAQLLFDWLGGDGQPSLLLYPVVLACGVLGGFAAALLAGVKPLEHGAAAAAAGYLGVQLVGSLRRTIVGEPVSSPLAWVLLALLMASMGMAGGALERKTRSMRSAHLGRTDHGDG